MLFTKCIRLLVQTQLKHQQLSLKTISIHQKRHFSNFEQIPQKIEIPKGAFEIQYSRSSGPGKNTNKHEH